MSGINTMPIGKFRGKNLDDINPQHLMDLYEEYSSNKKLSESQKIIYNYVSNNYDEIQKRIELQEDEAHNNYQLENHE